MREERVTQHRSHLEEGDLGPEQSGVEVEDEVKEGNETDVDDEHCLVGALQSVIASEKGEDEGEEERPPQLVVFQQVLDFLI